MWEMTLPPRLARLGRTLEFRRRAAALPAHADRHALGVVEGGARAQAALPPQRITVVPPGIDAVVLAGRRRESPTPLVVAVGRLVPVKRFAALIDALAAMHGAPARSCAR